MSKIKLTTLLLFCVVLMQRMECLAVNPSGKPLQDSMSKIVFHFRFDKSILDSAYMSNASSLVELHKTLSNKEIMSNMDSISITAATSPEGVLEHNIMLSRKRASAIKSYIRWKYPQTDPLKIFTHAIGENWSGLRDMVQDDTNVPYRDEVLKVLNQDVNLGTKEWRLRQIGSGQAFAYIEKNILRYLRSGAACVIFYLKPAVVESPVVVVEKPVVKEEPVVEPKQEEVVVEIVPEKPVKKLFAIKTNLAAYSILVANLGIEIPIGKHFSIDVPLYYSPYTANSNYNFRILAMQPEVRYWLKESLKGHFFGAHLMGGWYNVAYNDQHRYQDKDGDSPSWGAGLSYGYSLPMSNNWSMEFTAGFGYLYLNYDVFYNKHNGAKMNSESKHYWGPTKLGINLIYRFNK